MNILVWLVFIGSVVSCGPTMRQDRKQNDLAVSDADSGSYEGDSASIDTSTEEGLNRALADQGFALTEDETPLEDIDDDGVRAQDTADAANQDFDLAKKRQRHGQGCGGTFGNCGPHLACKGNNILEPGDNTGRGKRCVKWIKLSEEKRSRFANGMDYMIHGCKGKNVTGKINSWVYCGAKQVTPMKKVNTLLKQGSTNSKKDNSKATKGIGQTCTTTGKLSDQCRAPFYCKSDVMYRAEKNKNSRKLNGTRCTRRVKFYPGRKYLGCGAGQDPFAMQSNKYIFCG